MIRTFADKETEKIYNQIFSKKLPQSIQKVALRKLLMIDFAMDINDLRVPPGNHLERLVGDYQGWYSVRINDQYRILFTVQDENNFTQVQIVDYHHG
ncbi:type II toxin-antitoxin system RelE/ParE family toxin [Lentilactobacillus kisonensis]|nr:type II toxin-antitoxin system RelE/ParE family toxin [Lentilactobacillus kisonensis]